MNTCLPTNLQFGLNSSAMMADEMSFTSPSGCSDAIEAAGAESMSWHLVSMTSRRSTVKMTSCFVSETVNTVGQLTVAPGSCPNLNGRLDFPAELILELWLYNIDRQFRFFSWTSGSDSLRCRCTFVVLDAGRNVDLFRMEGPAVLPGQLQIFGIPTVTPGVNLDASSLLEQLSKFKLLPLLLSDTIGKDENDFSDSLTSITLVMSLICSTLTNHKRFISSILSCLTSQIGSEISNNNIIIYTVQITL